MSRLLVGVNRLHAAAAALRADVLAEQVAAVLRAEAAAVDFVSPDGRPLRLAVAGPATAWVATTVEDETLVVPDAGAKPRVTLHPPTEGTPALIRSVCRHDGVASSLVGWRAEPFDNGHAALLRLLHPAVAWAIEPTPAVLAPPAAPAIAPLPGVTGRVLELLLTGLPEKEIARRLERSDHTIHAHVKRVYKHFGVRSRPQLILTLGVAGRGNGEREAEQEPNDAGRVD